MVFSIFFPMSYGFPREFPHLPLAYPANPSNNGICSTAPSRKHDLRYREVSGLHLATAAFPHLPWLVGEAVDGWDGFESGIIDGKNYGLM